MRRLVADTQGARARRLARPVGRRRGLRRRAVLAVRGGPSRGSPDRLERAGQHPRLPEPAGVPGLGPRLGRRGRRVAARDDLLGRADWEIRGDVWSCRCERCQALFRERTGAAMPVEFAPEVKRSSRSSMADLLSDACTYARAKGLEQRAVHHAAGGDQPGLHRLGPGGLDRRASTTSGPIRTGSRSAAIRPSTSAGTPGRRSRSRTGTASTTTSGSRPSRCRPGGKPEIGDWHRRRGRCRCARTSPPGRTTAARRCRPASAAGRRRPGRSSRTGSGGSGRADDGGRPIASLRGRTTDRPSLGALGRSRSGSATRSAPRCSS